MAVKRYHRPRPRLALGRSLRGLASACIDVSDGLVADLTHLSDRSCARMVIELARVPISPLADLIGGAAGAIVAGDDYELLFTALPADETRLLAAASAAALAVTCIGQVVEGEGVEVLDQAGNAVVIDHGGYRHF